MGNSSRRAAGLATKRASRAAQQQIGVTYQPSAEAMRLEALDERHRQIVAEAMRCRRAMMGLP